MTCPHLNAPPSLLDLSKTIAQCMTCDTLSTSPYDLFYRCDECGRVDCASCRFPQSKILPSDQRPTRRRRTEDNCQEGHLFTMVSDPISNVCSVCGEALVTVVNSSKEDAAAHKGREDEEPSKRSRKSAICDSCVAFASVSASSSSSSSSSSTDVRDPSSSARTQCVNGHPLASLNHGGASSSSIRDYRHSSPYTIVQRICDACREEILPGETYYSCRLDDFDLCRRCRDGNAPLVDSSLASVSADTPLDIRPTPAGECTTNLHRRLALTLRNLAASPASSSFSSLTISESYVSLSTTHVHQTANYTCGYANTQMLISSLFASPTYASMAALAFSNVIPDVISLQRLLARAWTMGFDRAGSHELMMSPGSTATRGDGRNGGVDNGASNPVMGNGGSNARLLSMSTTNTSELAACERFIVNSRIQIGTTEVCAVLRSRGIPVAIVDVEGDFDRHVCPFVLDYFRYGGSEAIRRRKCGESSSCSTVERSCAQQQQQQRPPLYLQYSGHSLTIVGVVTFSRAGAGRECEIAPLVFDSTMNSRFADTVGNNNTDNKQQRNDFSSSLNSSPREALSPFFIPARGCLRSKREFEIIVVGEPSEALELEWFAKVMRPALRLNGI